MFGIFDKIEEFFKDLLLGGIQANLESMFLDINDKVGAIATDVGKTPMGWNGQVFSFIKSINDSVIIPIAGLIITAVLCIELINMVMQKNNMHDREILARKLKISQPQLKYVTNSNAGEGLLFFGNTIVPFLDKFPKDTILYQKMTTKPEEVR